MGYGDRAVDLTGQRFGRLTVVRLSGVRKAYARQVWECNCDCGNKSYVDTRSLTRGRTKSCGCLPAEPKDDITGRRFGKLTVRGYAGKGKWACDCDCGNSVLVHRGNLMKGITKSCGCLAGRPRNDEAAALPAPGGEGAGTGPPKGGRLG